MPSLLSSPRDGPISASNTEANSATFIIMGDHLNFAIPQGDHKNFTHTAGRITKTLQNLKNFQRPPPGKKWHVPYRVTDFICVKKIGFADLQTSN